jgi:hypothetical protein
LTQRSLFGCDVKMRERCVDCRAEQLTSASEIPTHSRAGDFRPFGDRIGCHGGRTAGIQQRNRRIEHNRSSNGRSRIEFSGQPGNLSAGNVEENGQRGRRSEYLPADMGIVGIRVETQVVEAIEQKVHRYPHFHASQVHSQADVCAVAP